MTNSEVSSRSRNYSHSIFQHEHDSGKSHPKEMTKSCNDIFELVSREERVALLKAGYTGKEIEFEYLRRNYFVVIGVNWQDRGFK